MEQKRMHITIIAAVSKNGVIGRDNRIPWNLADDLIWFQSVTMGHWLILGRKTFESLPDPLHGRRVITLSREPEYTQQGCWTAESLPEALRIAEISGDTKVFIGGGEQIYRAALPIANRMCLTRVEANVDGDAFFPEFDESNWGVVEKKKFRANKYNEYSYTIQILDRIEKGV